MSNVYKNATYAQYSEKTEELLSTLPPFCRDYCRSREIRLTKKTQYDYACKMKVFLNYLHDNNSYFSKKEIVDYTLDDIGLIMPNDAEEFVSWILRQYACEKEKRLNKKSTAENYIACLSSYYQHFYRKGFVPRNPFTGIDREKKKAKDIIYMKDNQKEAFLDAVCGGDGLSTRQKAFHDKNSIRDICICCLMLDTGIRVSELVGLDIEDIDFVNSMLHIQRKGDKPDTVYFSDAMSEILKEYLDTRNDYKPTDDNRAVFLVTIGKYQGERLSVRSVERIVKKYAKAANIPQFSKITPHKLRSTYAMGMLEKTHDISLLKEQLGHENISTSSLYAKASDEEKLAHRNDLQR